MANYKRKNSRRVVKCSRCTDGRQGNSMKDINGRTSVLVKKRKQLLSQKEQLREAS